MDCVLTMKTYPTIDKSLGHDLSPTLKARWKDKQWVREALCADFLSPRVKSPSGAHVELAPRNRGRTLGKFVTPYVAESGGGKLSGVCAETL